MINIKYEFFSKKKFIKSELLKVSAEFKFLPTVIFSIWSEAMLKVSIAGYKEGTRNLYIFITQSLLSDDITYSLSLNEKKYLLSDNYTTFLSLARFTTHRNGLNSLVGQLTKINIYD